MKMTFDVEAVRRCVEHARAAPKSRTLYGQDLGRGLFLVGDQGIYLVSNGDPSDLVSAERLFAAYPAECNPTTMEFDDWWAAKQEAFGRDDGIEFLPLATAEGMLETGRFEIDLTPGLMSFAVESANGAG